MVSSNIGGQAVMEGIMMKNKEEYAVAVRTTDGTIVVDTKRYAGSGDKCFGVAKLPFLRGVFNFVDSMVLGMRTLMYSASFFEEEEVGEKSSQKKEKFIMTATLVLSVILSVGIFMIFPYLMSALLKNWIPYYSVRTILEGFIRIGIFVGYILLISRMEDIQRTFMYHGAEHKCINCIEHGLPLTVENVKKSSRQHKRCGTSFIFFVLIISICLLIIVRVDGVLLRVLVRIALLPVIAGISYEVLRLAGRSDHLIIELLSKPGMAIQKLTTREPEDDMIEVGIQAVEAVFDWKAFLKDNFGEIEDES